MKKMIGMAAALLVCVCVLSGCGTSLQEMGSMFNLDLENSKLNCRLDAGLFGIETAAGDLNGSGDIVLDVQLDWKNKLIHCKVDTDSSGSGDSHLDFFLNWESRDTYLSLDSAYPSTEKEKAAGASEIGSLHFDFLLDLQKRNIDSNINMGPYEKEAPLSNETSKEGESAK